MIKRCPDFQGTRFCLAGTPHRLAHTPLHLAVVFGVTALLSAPSVRAYQAATTHVGLAEQAAYASGLHSWLRKAAALDQGLWEKLTVQPRAVPSGQRWHLVRDLFRLNPVHGYCPDAELKNRAVGWLLAGAVLEAVPSSRVRHHFFDPRTEKGLDQRTGRESLAVKLRFLDYLYGGGTLAGALTGANFDLSGKSALAWANSTKNFYSLRSHLKHRFAAVTKKTIAQRRHALAMALLTMGALAHLLQNMACPSYVRNDFVVSHLKKSPSWGKSPYALYVARRYGRYGLPRLQGKRVRRNTLRAFFKNKKQTGLAQTTARNYFSPGSLPPPKKVENMARITGHLKRFGRKRFARPPVWPLPLKSLEAGQTTYLVRRKTRKGFGPIRVAAYGISPQGTLKFWLERRVYENYAAELLPRAVRFSEGLIAYLLRGKLSFVQKEKSATIRIVNKGPGLAKGRLRVLIEDAAGKRTVYKKAQISTPRVKGKVLTTLSRSAFPKHTRAVAVAFLGTDTYGEPIVCEGRWSLPETASNRK